MEIVSSEAWTRLVCEMDFFFPAPSVVPPKAFILFFKALFLKVSPVSSSEVDLDISDISDIEERSFTDFVNAFIDCIDVPSPVSGTEINSSYQGSDSGQT